MIQHSTQYDWTLWKIFISTTMKPGKYQSLADMYTLILYMWGN